MTHRTAIQAVVVVGFLGFTPAFGQSAMGKAAKATAPDRSEIVTSTTGPLKGDLGAMSAPDPLAARAGLEMLQKGGNAVDAIVAAALANCVVRNGANGLGGYGGAMVIHRKDLPEPVVVDFNTRAPLAARPDMFDRDRSTGANGVLSISTWNTVAGLAVALERYGTMKWADVLQPAIRYADEGFIITESWAQAINTSYDRKLKRWPAGATYRGPDGGPLKAGDRFVQKDLAQSLKALAAEGPDAIYTGSLAKKMVEYLTSEGGIITMADLANWRDRHVRVLKPAHVAYRGYDLYTSPLATGGHALVGILNLLSGFDLPAMGRSARSIHLVLEASKVAFADRLWFAGDPWAVKVPYAGLMSRGYADARRKTIDPEVAWPYAKPGDPWPFETGGVTPFVPTATAADGAAIAGPAAWPPALQANDIPQMAPVGDTASTSSMDKDGNMVALTMTLRDMLGSGVTVPGTGITLNNGMGLFHPTESDTTRTPDHPNQIEGGKIAVNNMNAFLIFKSGQPVVTGGGAGGRRIITECLETILNLIDWKMDLQSAVDAPRYHVEQKEPSAVETAFPYGTAKELEARGHRLVAENPWGLVHVIERDPVTGAATAARDWRSESSAAGALVKK